jgi:hypothetical protein
MNEEIARLAHTKDIFKVGLKQLYWLCEDTQDRYLRQEFCELYANILLAIDKANQHILSYQLEAGEVIDLQQHIV